MKNAKLIEKTSKASLKNAKQYVEDAEVLCSFRSYGHALAFTILGNVEMGKTAIYNLYSKNLIPNKNLPEPYSTYYRNEEIEKFASEAWWIGYVLITNIEEILQNLIEVTQEVEVDPSGKFGIRLTKKGLTIYRKLISKLTLQNKKIKEFEKNMARAFLIKPDLETKTIKTPNQVEKATVKQQIKMAKKNIKTAEPFLNFPINNIQKNIIKMMLTTAFESILPIKKEISHFIIPVTIAYAK